MIKNWQYHNLYMDFSSMYHGNNHPSDIDLFYLGKDNFLIIGEIKSKRGTMKPGQRKILEQIIDGWKYDGMCLYIKHDKLYQNGDRVVNVAEASVVSYYYMGKWRLPDKKTKVKDVIKKYWR